MYDDHMDNVLVRYLEGLLERQSEEIRRLTANLQDVINEQAIEIMRLEVELGEALINLESAETYVDRMEKLFEKQHEEHLTANLAINIQAAEAEWQADEERCARIALLMRG